MSNLDEISYKLGQLHGMVANIEKNTSDIKTEVKSVSGRVAVIEDERKFEKGVQSQNKKIAGIAGSVGGAAGGALMTWLVKVFTHG